MGCEPASFSGHSRTWVNKTMVLYDKGGADELACVQRAEEEALDAAKAKYSGHVVMAKRGTCPFAQKWQVLKQVGAVGMVIVQNRKGARPVTMLLGDQYDDKAKQPNGIGYPACMTHDDAWDRFATLGNIVTDFRYLTEYRREDEKMPRNDVTGVFVSQVVGPPKQVPVAQATFNPQILTQTTARAWAVEFDPLCLSHPSTDECSTCYQLSNKFKDPEQVRGKIAVLKLAREQYYCFPWMYDMVAQVQLAGAVGVMYVQYLEELYTYIPHQVH